MRSLLKNLDYQLSQPRNAALLALASGIGMGLTVAPVGAWPLAWVALAPLWWLIAHRPRAPWWLHPALWWGLGYHGLALFWITGIHPMTWMGVPWLSSLAIAAFCWLFISLWGAALVVAWAIICRFLFRPLHHPLARVLAGTAVWCALETFWSAGVLWWTSLAYTQSPYNLAILHLGQISGANAVTAAIVAVNGLLAAALPSDKLEKSSKLPLNLAVLLLVSLHLFGWSLYNRPLPQAASDAIKVGIIQGNIPNTIKLFVDGRQRAMQNYTAGYLSLASQGVDAVLTPEGALPLFLDEVQRSPLYAAILSARVTTWLGAYGEQGLGYSNSLFTIAGDGSVLSRYDKTKLVPLGEYIPFEEILGKVVNRLSPLKAQMIAGKPGQQFDTPFGRAIAGICYESAFGEHFRQQAAAGGEFIVTASNNAHYSAAMPAQHHAQDVMRAIETDRWAARATNTGYSGIVDPRGRTVWMSGINTFEFHADTIYRQRSQTLYVRWGDWLTPLLLGLSILMWLFFAVPKFKTGQKKLY